MKKFSVYPLLGARWYNLSTVPKEWIRFFMFQISGESWDNNFAIPKLTQFIMCLKFIAAVMSVQVCNEIQKPGQNCF